MCINLKKMKNKLYINFIFILISGYFTLTIIGKLYAPKGEIFPFFHWGLYVTTPQVIEKDYIHVYSSFNDLPSVPQSFYKLIEKKMSISQARFLVKRLKNCVDKSCFEPAFEQINNLLPKNSYSVIYVENEFSQIDTIGIIKNNTFIKK